MAESTYHLNTSGAVKSVDELKESMKHLINQHKGLRDAYRRGKFSREEFQKITKDAIRDTDAVVKALGDEAKSVRGLTTHYKRLNNVLKERKSGKGSASGSAGLAIQELGRGIADFNVVGGLNNLEAGLRASTNNMEQLATTIGYTITKSGGLKAALGALGQSLFGIPGIILAFTTVIQFLPQIIDFFDKWKNGAEAAAKAQEELNQKADEMTAEEYLTQTQAINRDEISRLKAELADLDARQATAVGKGSFLQNYEERRAKINEELDKAIAFDNQLIDGMQHQAQVTLEAYEAQMKKNREAREEKERQKAITEELKKQKKIQDEFIKAHRELMSEVQGIEDEQAIFDNALKEAAGNIVDNPYAGNFFVQGNVEVIEDEIEALEDLESALRMVGSAYAGLSEEGAMKLRKEQDAAKESFEKFSGALISGFDAAASSGGNFFEQLGKGLLNSIGSFLIQEGTAAVLSGSTKIASGWAAPLGLTQVQAGYAEIAGGIALKAGGSAIGSSSRGGGGGASGNVSPSSSINQPQSVQTQSDTANNAPIAIAKVKGQDLILSIENAQYSRRGYLPN